MVSCTAAIVRPKEGDGPERAKYFQGITFYEPEVGTLVLGAVRPSVTPKPKQNRTFCGRNVLGPGLQTHTFCEKKHVPGPG